MAYENLAALYDGLMADIDYEAWADFIAALLVKWQAPGKVLADLGCGTGSISVPLAQRGYQVTGIDLSEEMLSVARAKAAADGVDICWLRQDMTTPEFAQPPDAVIATFDAVNYILEPEELQYLLQTLAQQMNDGGVLVFDINTPYKLREVLGNNIYSHHSEQVEYIWENQFDEDEQICQMLLTFFTLDEASGLYRKSVEYHEQRVYDPQLLVVWLQLSGFEVLGLYRPLELTAVDAYAQEPKVVIAARKM